MLKSTVTVSVAAVLIVLVAVGCKQTDKAANGKIKACPPTNSACTIQDKKNPIETRNTKGENKKFFQAIMKDDVKTVGAMLKTDKRFLNIRNVMNATPLHVAAKSGKTKCVKLLIEQGADVNAVNQQKRTPLHAACTHNHLDIAKYLIAHGANVNAKSDNLGTPLHDAAVNGNLEIAKYLLAKGADINSTSKRGMTPLIAALTRGKKEVSKYLIDKGAKFDQKTLLAANNSGGKGKNGEVFCCENL